MAVDPVLASTLYQGDGAERFLKRRKLESGLRSVDAALDGGVDYGRITCISAQGDSGAQDLMLALLVSHLMKPHASATIIDTTLSFDVKGLHQKLTDRLQREGSESAADEAVAILDRLRIMKVFDFIGMTESIAELRDVLEMGTTSSALETAVEPAPRGTVGDSEDEDETLDDPSPRKPGITSLLDQPVPSLSHGGDYSLLIIDNIAHITAPLLKNNHARGQALLNAFMRSLARLTHAYSLCTVLLNQASTYQQSKDETPSIFSSCALRPALGKAFAYMLDLHLLMHEVPRSNADARAMFGGELDLKQRKDVRLVKVVEVLHDRHGPRIGRWALFEVDERGMLKEVVDA